MSRIYNIDIHQEDAAWSDELEDPDSVCQKAIAAIDAELPEAVDGEISIALVSDDYIQTLNTTYRQKNKPTNVLSFPSVRAMGMLGDIVLARETIVREAEEREKSLHDHFTHLVIHGFLHLQGYDHQSEPEAEQMEGLEIRALSRLNIDNPYKINERDKT